MRTRRFPALLILVLLTLAAFVPSASAGPLADTERAQVSRVAVHLELWVLSAIEHIQEAFGFKTQALPNPAGGQGTNLPSVQSDCRSGIDPNGGCTP